MITPPVRQPRGVDTADADAGAGIIGVNDLAVAHVHGVVARIVDDVSCLCFIEADAFAHFIESQSWYIIAEMTVYGINESGTVSPVGEARAAVLIAVAYELEPVIHHLHPVILADDRAAVISPRRIGRSGFGSDINDSVDRFFCDLLGNRLGIITEEVLVVDLTVEMNADVRD